MLNTLHKNSTFFLCLLILLYFCFLTLTPVKAKFALDKIKLVRMTFFKAIALGEKPELRLNSTPLKRKTEGLLSTRVRVQS